jgi:hypothetical protein
MLAHWSFRQKQPTLYRKTKRMKGFGFFLSSASLVGFQTGSALPPASNHFWPNIRNEE